MLHFVSSCGVMSCCKQACWVKQGFWDTYTCRHPRTHTHTHTYHMQAQYMTDCDRTHDVTSCSCEQTHGSRTDHKHVTHKHLTKRLPLLRLRTLHLRRVTAVRSQGLPTPTAAAAPQKRQAGPCAAHFPPSFQPKMDYVSSAGLRIMQCVYFCVLSACLSLSPSHPLLP